MKQSVGDANISKTHKMYHNFRSAKIVRRRKSSAGSLSSVKLDPYDMIIHDSCSPYYKGLTDQSLAILDESPHTPTSYFLSSTHSPYYKGLTDYSLAIGSPLPVPALHNHPIYSLPHESSPYYRGLIDYSLALHGPSSQPISNAYGIKFAAPSSPPKELMADADADAGFLFEQEPEPAEEMELMSDVELETEEKPLRERVSEATILDQGKGEELKHYGMGNESSVSEQTEVACKEEGKVYVWATKYQPVTLADFICNKHKALQLKQLVKDGCGCNHFIFEGPASVGKRSMIRAMLREVFGADRVQVTEECKDFNLKAMHI